MKVACELLGNSGPTQHLIWIQGIPNPECRNSNAEGLHAGPRRGGWGGGGGGGGGGGWGGGGGGGGWVGDIIGMCMLTLR